MICGTYFCIDLLPATFGTREPTIPVRNLTVLVREGRTNGSGRQTHYICKSEIGKPAHFQFDRL
jgi:hypothetical protein